MDDFDDVVEEKDHVEENDDENKNEELVNMNVDAGLFLKSEKYIFYFN